MSHKVTLTGTDFRNLIAQLTKVPSIGAFLGSELINLEVKNGSCYGSTYGIVLATAEVPAKGTMPLICIDERLLMPYSVLCETAKQVVIEIVDKEVVIRNSKGRKIIASLQTGKHYSIEIPPDVKPLKLDGKIAKKIDYLADIAFSDASMPHLNCVYVSNNGVALAVNQKCIAKLSIPLKLKNNVAVAIPISKVLGDGYEVYVSPQLTVATNGTAFYSMSSPVQAQQGFPVQQVLEYFELDTNLIVEVNSQTLQDLATDCSNCLSNISRVDVVLSFRTDGQQNVLKLYSENGSAKFDSDIKTINMPPLAELNVPLEEFVKALPFMEGQKVVRFYQGAKGETYLSVADGMLMYTSYSTPKKKSKKKKK